MEDVYQGDEETILVSTMHKAKGREFDNVFLLLNHVDTSTIEEKRLLYVAMTRAKQNLSIHLNTNALYHVAAPNVQRYVDKSSYGEQNEIYLHLNHKEVWLDYFINKQQKIAPLKSGDTLGVTTDGCSDPHGASVLKFSKSFLQRMEYLKAKGYSLKSAKVNFVIYWKREDSENEIRIILPELLFERTKKPQTIS